MKFSTKLKMALFSASLLCVSAPGYSDYYEVDDSLNDSAENYSYLYNSLWMQQNSFGTGGQLGITLNTWRDGVPDEQLNCKIQIERDLEDCLNAASGTALTQGLVAVAGTVLFGAMTGGVGGAAYGSTMGLVIKNDHDVAVNKCNRNGNVGRLECERS